MWKAMQPPTVAYVGTPARDGYDGAPGVKPVLQLKGVDKTYTRGDEQVHVLVDFDLTLDAGEFVVVTGPSGAGKSTLPTYCGGLDAPDSGTVAVTGQDVWSMSTGARRVPAAQPRIRVPMLASTRLGRPRFRSPHFAENAWWRRYFVTQIRRS